MKKIATLLFFALLVLAVYLPAHSVPFYYDDYQHFVENHQILHASSLLEVLQNGKQETRPVFNLSLALQAYLFGTDLVAAHVGNLLLFFGSGLLFWFLVMRVTRNETLSFWATSVFLVHPLAVESVVYFNSRSGLLALFFSLAAWLALLHRTRVSFWFGLCLLVLAIGSKEDAAASVPIAWLLLYREEEFRWKSFQGLLLWLPLLAIPVIYLLFQSPHIDTVGGDVQPWYQYLWYQGVYLPLHLGRFIIPWPLTLNWDLSQAWFSLSVVFGGWVFLASLVWVIWRRWGSFEALGVAWMIVALLPTHSVVPLLDIQATRISFPALPGFALLVASLLGRFFQRSKKPALVVGGLLLLLLSWRTIVEIQIWKEPVKMWERNVEMAPSRWRAWVNLATEYGQRGRWEESWYALSRAGSIHPTKSDILYNQAVVAAHRNDGQADRLLAVAKLKEIPQGDPNYGRAKEFLRQLGGGSGALGE